MKIVLFIPPIALALGAAISTSAATVITFDNLTGGPIFGGDLVTSQYSGLGVIFSDTYSGGAHANNTLTSFISGSSPPNVLWVDQGSGGSTGQYLQIDFSPPVIDVSTVFGTSTNADITLSAYNGGGLLGSVNLVGGTVIAGASRSGQVSFSSAQGITSVHLFSNPVGSSRSFNFDIDNLTFDPIPEPEFELWLGLGLSLICARRFLRRD